MFPSFYGNISGTCMETIPLRSLFSPRTFVPSKQTNFVKQKIMTMEVKKDIKDELIASAQRLMYYNELLIEQCNGWLPAEEGNRIMEQRILEQMRKEKKEKIKQQKPIIRFWKWICGETREVIN